MLEELHTGHPGIVQMKVLARSYLWWPNVDQEIEQTVRNCASCQQVRKPPAVAPLAPWMWPSNPWHRVHVDYVHVDYSGTDGSVLQEPHEDLQGQQAVGSATYWQLLADIPVNQASYHWKNPS